MIIVNDPGVREEPGGGTNHFFLTGFSASRGVFFQCSDRAPAKSDMMIDAERLEDSQDASVDMGGVGSQVALDFFVDDKFDREDGFEVVPQADESHIGGFISFDAQIPYTGFDVGYSPSAMCSWIDR